MPGPSVIASAAAAVSRPDGIRRLILGYVVLWTVVRTSHWMALTDLPDRRSSPVGPLSWFDASIDESMVVALVLMTVGTASYAVLRNLHPAPIGLASLGFLVLTTHGNGWGQVLHTENLPAIHLLVVAALTPAANLSRPDLDRWMIRALGATTVATYFVAGVAKLRFGGEAWLDGETLRLLVAHDNLRKELLGDPSSPVAAVLVDQHWLFRPAVFGSLAIELGAPLALIPFGRRLLAPAWITVAWLFHLAVLVSMAVLFLYPLTGIAFVALMASSPNSDGADAPEA